MHWTPGQAVALGRSRGSRRTLTRWPKARYVVSQDGRQESQRSACNPKALRRNGVSRPTHEDSGRFLNHRTDFRPNGVSHHVPVDLRPRVRPDRRCLALHLNQALSQPTVPLPTRMPGMPRRARPSVPLTLALRSPAHSLAIALVNLRPEPSPAHRTRTFPRCRSHDRERRPEQFITHRRRSVQRRNNCRGIVSSSARGDRFQAGAEGAWVVVVAGGCVYRINAR